MIEKSILAQDGPPGTAPGDPSRPAVDVRRRAPVEELKGQGNESGLSAKIAPFLGGRAWKGEGLGRG